MIERQTSHVISTYFAPRGRKRMYALGMHLVQLYLNPTDKLIGIIGEAGSGKSALIRGMFPGRRPALFLPPHLSPGHPL